MSALLPKADIGRGSGMPALRQERMFPAGRQAEGLPCQRASCLMESGGEVLGLHKKEYP